MLADACSAGGSITSPLSFDVDATGMLPDDNPEAPSVGDTRSRGFVCCGLKRFADK